MRRFVAKHLRQGPFDGFRFQTSAMLELIPQKLEIVSRRWGGTEQMRGGRWENRNHIGSNPRKFRGKTRFKKKMRSLPCIFAPTENSGLLHLKTMGLWRLGDTYGEISAGVAKACRSLPSSGGIKNDPLNAIFHRKHICSVPPIIYHPFTSVAWSLDGWCMMDGG